MTLVQLDLCCVWLDL